MSVIQTNPVYVCDFCGERDLQYYSSGSPNWGIGVKFKRGRNPQTWSYDTFLNCDKHLCGKCILGVSDIAKRLETRGFITDKNLV
jgi:hypothetical protein